MPDPLATMVNGNKQRNAEFIQYITSNFPFVSINNLIHNNPVLSIFIQFVYPRDRFLYVCKENSKQNRYTGLYQDAKKFLRMLDKKYNGKWWLIV